MQSDKVKAAEMLFISAAGVAVFPHSGKYSRQLRYGTQAKSRFASLGVNDAGRALDVAQQHVELLDIDDLDFERQDTLQRVCERSAVRLRDVDFHFAHDFDDILEDTDAVCGDDLDVDRARG